MPGITISRMKNILLILTQNQQKRKEDTELPGKLDSNSEPIHYIFFFSFFWLRRAACRILDLRPGIKPVPPAVEAQRLNHWTTREVPIMFSIGPRSKNSLKDELFSDFLFMEVNRLSQRRLYRGLDERTQI